MARFFECNKCGRPENIALWQPLKQVKDHHNHPLLIAVCVCGETWYITDTPEHRGHITFGW